MKNINPLSLTMNDITAEHPWIREDGEAPDKPLDLAVLTRMKQFRAMNKLKKVALKVVIVHLIQFTHLSSVQCPF